MNISVIGCGRWGTLIAYYLDTLHHPVTLYGRKDSAHFRSLRETRKNEYLTLPETVIFTADLKEALKAETVIISIPSQNLRALSREIQSYKIKNHTFVLCMKGLEIGTGERLSQVIGSYLGKENRIAVWLGPGHVQEFYRGIPNCMVIDSDDETVKHELISAFAGPLIRFYYGNDLIGNEIGAATKNVIGIAAGILDGLGLTSLKGALMSRGTREVARLITAMGGNELSAYGLCHLGDYEATVFSPYSHNRSFGEAFVKGETYPELAEGCHTVKAVMEIAREKQLDLPIATAVYRILYEKAEPQKTLRALFDRSLKKEF